MVSTAVEQSRITINLIFYAADDLKLSPTGGSGSNVSPTVSFLVSIRRGEVGALSKLLRPPRLLERPASEAVAVILDITL